METLLQELKIYVRSSGWTYAVIWKIGPDHRTPVWLVSYFNEHQERETGQAQLFENIYRRCQFTPVRPGYAYLAWLRQSPYWWSRQLMEPVPTDQNKELFLTQAKIQRPAIAGSESPVCTSSRRRGWLSIFMVFLQTLVCFPGRAPTDGSGYCVELASTLEVPESEMLKSGIRDFISTSIAPHISSTQPSLLQEEVPALATSMSPAAMAAVARQQDSDILNDINIQASLHGDDEAVAGFGNIVNREEPYYPWTTPSSSHYVSAGLSPSNYPIENFGDYNYQNLDISTFNIYGGSNQILGFPELEQGVGTAGGQTVEPNPDWTPIRSGTSSTQGSSKGKEILVQKPPHKASLTLPPTSRNLSLLQQESLDKLRFPPALQQPPSLGPPAQDFSSLMIVPPPGYRVPSTPSSAGLRAIGGQVPPGHCPRSLFQPLRPAHLEHVLRSRTSSKRASLIYKWATVVAPRIMTVRGRLQGLGSSGAERLGSFEGSPTSHSFDPRSPNSLAHDHLAAETHKIKERERRSKMNTKLRTLISIVPIINKNYPFLPGNALLNHVVREFVLLAPQAALGLSQKDKVSVLTSTIKYIRQLTSRISNFEGVEEAAAAPATISVDRGEELALFSNTDSAGAGPSSSSSVGAPVVKMEVSPDGNNWLIKVQAYNHSRSLIQLLNVFQERGLEVITVDYGTMNGRFRANVSIKNPRNSSTSSSELQAAVCRVLETVESSTTGSD